MNWIFRLSSGEVTESNARRGGGLPRRGCEACHTQMRPRSRRIKYVGWSSGPSDGEYNLRAMARWNTIASNAEKGLVKSPESSCFRFCMDA